ncbi:g12290 [Coccomyxa viridis]|uniref:G12290 protein n=1 Tax=Coccomyxa viridis TaxID=1274662 RepID=A0ABP1G9Z2_9CHLO
MQSIGTEAHTSAESRQAPNVGVEPYITHSWQWRDHTINYAVAGCGPPVVFVHGFGASIGHFRKNVPALSQNYKVYAIDLLGFGRSDKPLLSYSTELWRDQVLDFLAEFVDGPAILVGNSIGSLISLMASAEGGAERVKGTVLLNCAGGMNTKGLTDDWRVRLAFPIFRLIDFLLSRQRVARYLFNNFRTKDNLRKVLQRVYINPDAVDDALVDLIHTPSEAEGALEAFVSVISGPPGPRPEAIFDRVSGPILLLWGQRDEVTPLDGPVAKFMKAAADSRPHTQFKVLQGVGHCLHDEDPHLVNGMLLKWLQEHHAS